MEFPLDKESMRSFLGMINYLNRYSVLSAHLAAPLSAPTHQAVDYKPSKVYFENFNILKMEVSNMRVLLYFDVNAETTLRVDASKKRLCACLIQKEKVICYASRALTKTGQNYQNLESAPEMHQTHQELIKRQGNNSKPERQYQELLPGTPVWVQHKQNATWEPAIVVNQCAPNSYWIMQENGTEQPRVYRHTRTMLKKIYSN